VEGGGGGRVAEEGVVAEGVVAAEEVAEDVEGRPEAEAERERVKVGAAERAKRVAGAPSCLAAALPAAALQPLLAVVVVDVALLICQMHTFHKSKYISVALPLKYKIWNYQNILHRILN